MRDAFEAAAVGDLAVNDLPARPLRVLIDHVVNHLISAAVELPARPSGRLTGDPQGDPDPVARRSRKLGRTQENVLDALLRHGQWPGAWVWGTASGTRRVLESLVRAGLARVEARPGGRIYLPVLPFGGAGQGTLASDRTAPDLLPGDHR